MRTGSTLFCGLAETFPDVESTYEALSEWNYTDLAIQDLDEAIILLHGTALRGQTTVAKVFHEHLDRLDTTWTEFAERLPEARWMQLYRHDVAAQFISLIKARASQRWIDEGGDPGPASKELELVVDLGELTAFYTETVELDQRAAEALRDRPGFVQICYEDFRDDPAAWANETLAPLLEVAPVPVTVPYRRQTDRDLADTIANPEALAEAERLGIRWHPFR